MPGRALVGAINPPTQVVLARPITQRADPRHGVAALRQIWRHAFGGDTHAMPTALIATDWRHLQHHHNTPLRRR
ncbi:hypothetical protein [Micromonospora sp. C95]|uniref:hypothetical protein n=1 Tax=Micromonospora sp. C95 TaxID=2824882 RepID=UPI001B37EACD|nr:hypothetical protein [Micromonospora sp. C95]MBQ1022796.1 hypothetical protein [Micromonospora sp. C95]